MVCSCNAIANSHQTNNSTKISASRDSSNHGCSHMKTALSAIPGRATKNANRLILRSYSKRTRLRGGFRNEGVRLPRGLEPILFHPPIQSSATEPQHFSGLADIPL